jgi:6-phospho-beta-glucosidase
VRLTVLGGGGFRVPLVHRALLADADSPVTELVLYDTDATRLRVITAVLAAQAAEAARAGAAGSGSGGRPARTLPVRVAETLDDAVRGAAFVFCAMRVGGTAGRVRDESVPLAEGVLGQETVGAGGVLYGLRTVPVALDIARRVAALAPDAWVITFTNPAGIVTEAMTGVLGDRVIGICDSPVGLVRRAARAAGADPATVGYDYVGLNHLGWLRALTTPDGRDLLPGLLADPAALGSFEEGRLFGADWLATLGSLPNEYLHYYYFRRESLAAVQAAAASPDGTRGAFLDRRQSAFFAAAADDPARAYELWERARREREETYLADGRAAAGGFERDAEDLEGGGYDRVALALMRAIALDEPRTLILNVRSAGALPGFPADAVAELPCRADATGAHPLPLPTPPDAHQSGLMLTVKAVERATIEAATRGSRRAALRALALHPLVDSPAVAARILTASGWRG